MERKQDKDDQRLVEEEEAKRQSDLRGQAESDAAEAKSAPKAVVEESDEE